MKSWMTGAACALMIAMSLVSVRAQGDGPAVAATVNGEPITMDQWRLKMQSLHAQDFLASANPLRFKGGNGGQVALEELVNARLIVQYAAKVGLLASDAEVETEYAKYVKRPEVAAALAKKQVTEEQIRSDIRLQFAIFNVATINNSVTADEVKGYYESHPDQFGGVPEKWRLSIIRVGDQAAVDKVKAALKNGTPFETVASQYSDDTNTRVRGGDTGMTSSADPGIPDFVRTAVRVLRVGEITPPLAQPVAGGKVQYFFVRKTAAEPAKAPQPFAESEVQARRLALLAKVGGVSAIEPKLVDFRKQANIVVSVPGYEEMYKKQ